MTTNNLDVIYVLLRRELDNWSDIYDLKADMINLKSVAWIALILSALSLVTLGVILWVVL